MKLVSDETRKKMSDKAKARATRNREARGLSELSEYERAKQHNASLVAAERRAAKAIRLKQADEGRLFCIYLDHNADGKILKVYVDYSDKEIFDATDVMTMRVVDRTFLTKSDAFIELTTLRRAYLTSRVHAPRKVGNNKRLLKAIFVDRNPLNYDNRHFSFN